MRANIKMILAVAFIGFLVVGCHQATRAHERTADTSSVTTLELTSADSSLSRVAGRPPICVDDYATLRRQGDPGARCMPCLPLLSATKDEILQHARALSKLIGHAPFGPNEYEPTCVRQTYDLAVAATQHDPDVQVERALFMSLASDIAQRVGALRTVDRLIGEAFAASDTALALRTLAAVGYAFLDRAEQMDARAPSSAGYGVRGTILPLDEREKLVHELELNQERRPLKLANLPAIPTRSQNLGTSEALWASRIFARASSLASGPDLKSKFIRLSLAPFVLLEQWTSLDSASRVIMAQMPSDSVAPVAFALARYRLARNNPAQFPAVMELFDNALHRMPRADSASYDALDHIFTADDDSWRYGFVDNARKSLEKRAWALLDPLWLTPVNEVLLERRARVAEANFRYADIAVSGQAGSETVPGIMLVKRGVPERKWTAFRIENTERNASGDNVSLLHFLRPWPGLNVSLSAADDVAWHAFYSQGTTLESQALRLFDQSTNCAKDRNATNLFECVQRDNADFMYVPFYAVLDTIDVTLARFRYSADSIDMYVGARTPMRRMRSINDPNVDLREKLVSGLTIADEFGSVIFQKQSASPLPRVEEGARVDQWRVRVGTGRIMHRVEALDMNGHRGARGSRRPPSSKETFFDVEGFGMSDILVADSIAASASATSWRQLRVLPNGGVFEPNEQLALAWETYGLKPDVNGRLRWKVTLRWEDGRAFANSDVRALIVGSPEAHDQVHPVQPDASTITYTRDAAANPTVLDYLRFVPGGIAVGYHVLVIEIHDLVADARTTRSTAIRILPKAAQRRKPGELRVPSKDPAGYQAPMPPPPPIIKPPPQITAN